MGTTRTSEPESLNIGTPFQMTLEAVGTPAADSCQIDCFAAHFHSSPLARPTICLPGHIYWVAASPSLKSGPSTRATKPTSDPGRMVPPVRIDQSRGLVSVLFSFVLRLADLRGFDQCRSPRPEVANREPQKKLYICVVSQALKRVLKNCLFFGVNIHAYEDMGPIGKVRLRPENIYDRNSKLRL